MINKYGAIIYNVADFVASLLAIIMLFRSDYQSAILLWIASEVFGIQAKLHKILEGK